MNLDSGQTYRREVNKMGEREGSYENPVVMMNNALRQIEKQKRSYNDDLSIIDGAISDLYHDIERDNSIDLYKVGCTQNV